MPFPSIKVGLNHFTAASKVYSSQSDGLAAIVRNLAVDNARLKLQVAGVADFVNNSTGVVNGTNGANGLVDIVARPAIFNATSAGGFPVAAGNAALVKIRDAHRVMVNRINIARSNLGLPSLVTSEGTEVTAGTIAAMDRTSTAVAGTLAASYASYVASVAVVKANQRKLKRAYNEVITALDYTVLRSSMVGDVGADFTLAAIPVLVASATGNPSVSNTDGIALLVASSNNVATLAAHWNAAFAQGTPGPLNVVAA
jgi:hypothetical protein